MQARPWGARALSPGLREDKVFSAFLEGNLAFLFKTFKIVHTLGLCTPTSGILSQGNYINVWNI